MSLVPWRKPTAVTDPISEFLDNDPFLRSFFNYRNEGALNRGWYPAVDVHEEENQFVVLADLPGVKKDQINVSYDNGVLTIEGQRQTEKEKKDKGFVRLERSYGQFARSIHLGNNVDSSKIKAQFKDGVLEISIPKSEQARAKVINIE